MTNNDLLIRLRYALDIKNTDMVEIFKLGNMELSKEDVMKILTKPQFDEDGEIDLNNPDFKLCDYETLEAFLNGFVTFKRGKQEQKPGQTKKAPESISKRDTANNLFIKRVKIALSLTTEDMIDVFYDAGLNVSKGEIGAILRKADHRNYKECGDNFTRNFIKGLTMRYREPQQQ